MRLKTMRPVPRIGRGRFEATWDGIWNLTEKWCTMKVFLGGARQQCRVRTKVRYGATRSACWWKDAMVPGADQHSYSGCAAGYRGTLFFTHTHLDHLIGLPALTKAWPHAWFCRAASGTNLARVFPPVADPPRARCVRAVIVGSLQIAWQPVAHPDGCVAYRVDEPATGASWWSQPMWVAGNDAACQDEFCRFAADGPAGVRCPLSAGRIRLTGAGGSTGRMQ